MHALWWNERTHCIHFDTAWHESAITLGFWHQQRLAGDLPFCQKFAFKETNPPSKNADFDRFLLVTSQPKEIAKKFKITNRKSTTGFPTSYRWSVYVTQKSPKSWLKKRLFLSFFVIKFNFNRTKSATKFLCVKTSSSKLVVQQLPHLTVHRYWCET